MKTKISTALYVALKESVRATGLSATFVKKSFTKALPLRERKSPKRQEKEVLKTETPKKPIVNIDRFSFARAKIVENVVFASRVQ